MVKVLFLVFLFVIGAGMGSFACCQARRIHRREEKKKPLGKWSVCESCGKRLGFFENIPILSWVFLKGKCKKCKSKIGVMEILSEIGTGAVFALLGWFSYDKIQDGNAFEITKFVLLLILTVCFAIGFIYDAKWGMLPNSVLVGGVLIAVIYLVLRVIAGEKLEWMNVVSGVGLLAGTYYLLYLFSKEKLVGSGDWPLALAVSLIFGDWWLSVLVLFLSNFMASVIMVPVAIKKKKKHMQIPFGPFLIAAFYVVFLLQDFLLKFIIR